MILPSTESSLQFIKQQADSLRDPLELETCLKTLEGNDPTRPGSRWSTTTLSHGTPALILLFATLDKLFPEEGWDESAHAHILHLKKAIEKEGIASLSIFSGLSGICFSILQASREGTRYQNLLQKLHAYLIQELEKGVFSELEEKIQLGIASRMEDYELISGITGVGSYFLEIKEEKTLQKVLKLLIDRTKNIKIGTHSVPGWYVPSHFQFIAEDKKKFPKGNFNLGMAHGIAGPLTLLSLCLLEGIHVEGQKEAIEKMGKWLVERRSTFDGEIYWPDRVSFEEETAQKFANGPITFDAWCYGSAGVARALYLASQATKDSAMKEASIAGFEAIAYRKKSLWNLNTSSLCHGFSGTMLMMHLMARDTKIPLFNSACTEMQEHLLEQFDPDTFLGFFDFEPLIQDQFISNQTDEVRRAEFIKVQKAGLLDGISGILLALLSLEKGDTSWAAPFLIDRSHR